MESDGACKTQTQKAAAVQAALAAHVAPPRAAFAIMSFGASSREGWSAVRKWGLRIVSSEAFDVAVGIVIVLNGIVIGLEIDWKTADNEAVFAFLENAFLAMFCLELAMKVYVFRCRYFMLLCHWLDLCIVVLGFFAVCMRFVSSMQSAARQIQLFKLTRLMRLVRLIRISTQFRSLWILVQGLSSCVAPVCATVALVALTCYVFAVIALEYLSTDPELQTVPWGRLGHTLGQKFSSMPLAIFSLLELFVLNAVAGEAYDVGQQQPLAILYVLAFVFIVGVALLNLLTGVGRSALPPSTPPKA